MANHIANSYWTNKSQNRVGMPWHSNASKFPQICWKVICNFLMPTSQNGQTHYKNLATFPSVTWSVCDRFGRLCIIGIKLLCFKTLFLASWKSFIIHPVTILFILAEPGTRQAEEEQFLSRAFFWVALFFILWLILVWRRNFSIFTRWEHLDDK